MKSIYSFVVTVLLSSCITQPFQYLKTDNGLECIVKEDTIRLSVFADNIFKVSHRKVGHIDTVNQIQFVNISSKIPSFVVEESERGVQLVTGQLTACVLASGDIEFRNNNKKLLTTALFPDSTFEQQFVGDEEAIMGLGQYQNGLLNLKGVPLRLQQYNQEIANPFMVSTNGYGVLWENTSVTDFNYPVQQLDSWETVDSVRNVKKTVFIPRKSGRFKFAIESVNEQNRFAGPVLLTFNGDTAIHYNTTWVPDFHSGEIELEKGEKYEVFFTNSNTKSTIPTKVLYNDPDCNITTFCSRYGNGVDYYLVAGTPSEAIIGYRELTGKAPMFGKWAFGFWQCRERYHNQQELLENAAEYRKRGIPVDNIVQDWNYWPEKTWGPEWNRELYPKPEQMCKSLSDMNFHFMVSVWPWLNNKSLEDTYGLKEFKIDDTNNLDFFNSDLRSRYYQMLNDSMFTMGVNSIWLDGTEPESFPKGTTAMGDINHNALAYSYLVTSSVYEGKRKDYPDSRVFNLTRSGFAGQQCYGAAVWSGDVLASWEQFAEQVTAGLNLSMSGLPYWTTDIGGFFRDSHSLNPLYDDQYTNDRFKELLTRWFQFGAFCPLFRIHGYVSNTEVWRYGKLFEEMACSFIDLSYRLMPYIYSESAKVTIDDAILMKPLMHDYPQDSCCWDIKDQFLFGSSLMVCPVVKEGVIMRNVYLPQGKWFDFWNGTVYEGKQNIEADAPLDKLPLFIKAGSIIPVGEKVQYAMQKVQKPIQLFVYPGADGVYQLYEDEGESYAYEHGEYSTILFRWNDAIRTLVIEPCQGEFQGMEYKRLFDVVVVNNQTKGLENIEMKQVQYTGEKVTVECK